MTKTAHKWANEITSYVNGNIIWFAELNTENWIPVSNLYIFDSPLYKFKIKPKDPVYVYKVIYCEFPTDDYRVSMSYYESLLDFDLHNKKAKAIQLISASKKIKND